MDLATGTADTAILLGTSDHVKKVVGLDMSKEMISIGDQKVVQKNLQEKVKLGIGNGMDLPLESESKDLVTITFGIRNFGDYKKGLMEMYRVLTPGGRCVIMEFSLPTNPIIKAFYLFYFRNFLPFIGNLISKDDMAYSYLNKTVETFPYGKDFSDQMKLVGFKSVEIHPLTFGIASIYIAKK